jgi:hypothetical protein
LERLYDFNNLPENSSARPYEPGNRQTKSDVHHWGGPMTRRALHAIYTIAFICMLRSDEVLKTQMEHLEILSTKVILTLPFRKTHQFGGNFCFISFEFKVSDSMNNRSQTLRAVFACTRGGTPVCLSCNCRVDYGQQYNERLSFLANGLRRSPICP